MRKAGKARRVDTRPNFTVRVDTQQRELDAAAQHYAGLGGPKDPRAEALESESADAVRIDEMAEKLRALGCPATQALRYVEAVLGVISATDEKLAGGLGGAAADEESIFSHRPDAMEAVRMMAIKLVQAPKPRFSAGCLLLAAGIEYHGIRSERDWAKQQQVSPEWVSVEVKEWQTSMRLPKTSAQKTPAACRAYKETNGARKK